MTRERISPRIDARYKRELLKYCKREHVTLEGAVEKAIGQFLFDQRMQLEKLRVGREAMDAGRVVAP